MPYPRIKASDTRIGGFCIAANPNWPYVREVIHISERGLVLYKDYAYETGRPGFVSRHCGKSSFAAWAGRELTTDYSEMAMSLARALAAQGRYDPEEAREAHIFWLGRDRIDSHT